MPFIKDNCTYRSALQKITKANINDWIVTDTPSTADSSKFLMLKALSLAAQLGEVGFVDSFIKMGAEINAKGEGGFTALSYAAQLGQLDVLTRLLQEDGINIITSDDGGSPLYLSAYNKHFDAVKILVRYYKSIDRSLDDCHVGQFGFSPANIASVQGSRDIHAYLVSEGAKAGNSFDGAPIVHHGKVVGMFNSTVERGLCMHGGRASAIIDKAKLSASSIFKETDPIKACLTSSQHGFIQHPKAINYLYINFDTEEMQNEKFNTLHKKGIIVEKRKTNSGKFSLIYRMPEAEESSSQASVKPESNK